MKELRNATFDDLPQLREIASTAFKHDRYWLDRKLDPCRVKDYYAKIIERLIKVCTEKPEKNCLIVASSEEKILGYIALKIDDFHISTFGIQWGRILTFALKEEYRNMGIGSKILERALEWFISKKIEKVDVWTDSENISAIQCYEKAGFRTIYSGLTLTKNLDN